MVGPAPRQEDHVAARDFQVSIPAILLTVFLSIAGMELFAWWAHKYIMHGWGWGWHRDHHEPHDNVLEKNDLYAVTFGTIVFAMFAVGYVWSDLLWWIAFGITCYGLIYTFVHDGLVHQRYFRDISGADAASSSSRSGAAEDGALRQPAPIHGH